MSDIQASYKHSGVDIDAANVFVERIKPIVRSTFRREVLGDIGSFGGLFAFDPSRYRNPILVSSTDGVGTKLRVAQMMNRHRTVGIDLVAMGVNDLIVQGAEPLFFLDYIAVGRIDVNRNVEIIEGIAAGCREAGCALIGGENAEMPGFYGDDEYDLAGFCVGVVDKDHLIDGSCVASGDCIIGLPSSGIHSNGLSLARKVLFDMAGFTVTDKPSGLLRSLGEELLEPTRIYVKPLLKLLESFTVNGMVHVTGGGFLENIPRMLPAGLCARITKDSWIVPPIFSVIQKLGNVAAHEMYRVFNMGIGMVLIVPGKSAGKIADFLTDIGEEPRIIGSVVPEVCGSERVRVE
ncbi:MAG: phosphoribosylformylglycinamidine cyclo-ligase [Deltaproteobacteria bacterium]|nr:phosphoribosylformylglycinamidine cyclo-ligase [Deltaproteobacteria bacterium]